MKRSIPRDLRDIGKAVYYAGLKWRLLPSRRAQSFVIASGPRTGSTHLQRMLNSHPKLVCMHELFTSKASRTMFFRHYLGDRRKLIELRSRDYREFLEQVLLSRQAPWVEAIGFKAMSSQPQTGPWEEAWTALSEIDSLRVIWLSRNEVRSAVSYMSAVESGNWVGRSTTGTIQIDIERFLRFMKQRCERERATRELLSHRAILDVSYEDLIERTESELERICQFLGIQSAKLGSGLRKQNQKKLREFVSNFDDLHAALQGTEWEEACDVAGTD